VTGSQVAVQRKVEEFTRLWDWVLWEVWCSAAAVDAAVVDFFLSHQLHVFPFLLCQLGMFGPAITVVENLFAKGGFEAITLVVENGIAGIPHLVTGRGHGGLGDGDEHKREYDKFEFRHDDVSDSELPLRRLVMIWEMNWG
jgi:hypothetical protein